MAASGIRDPDLVAPLVRPRFGVHAVRDAGGRPVPADRRARRAAASRVDRAGVHARTPMTAAQIVYNDVPAEVTRVTALRWRQGAPPVPLVIAVARTGARTSLTFDMPPQVVVLLNRADGAYLIDGPIESRDVPA